MPLLPFILSGFMLGLFSSFHCIGMCGPLALSIPVQDNSASARVRTAFLYNAGRVVTYSLLGAIAGALGGRFYEGGWQRWFSIVLGILLLFTTLRYFIWPSSRSTQGLFGAKLQQVVRFWLHRRTLAGTFMLGMANGLLPCGMVYVALTTSLATSRDVWQGIIFMASYGAGTIPLMFSFTVFTAFFKWPVRRYIRKASPYIAAAMGILLILRGLNLGLPFVSPQIPTHPGESIECHK